MGSGGTATFDEAYQRLHVTGPEFDGWLSNHGPMAAEAMVRHGHAGQVHRWLAPSVAASWAAAAALTAIYAPAAPAPQAGLPACPAGPQAVEETIARAVEHGDEHVIKFADTAADVYARTGNADALAAAIRATQLIAR